MSDVEMESASSSWEDDEVVQFYEKVPMTVHMYDAESDCILTVERDMAFLDAQVYDERGNLRPFGEEPSLKNKNDE